MTDRNPRTQGPNVDDADAADAFLRRQGWVALCYEDEGGNLCAVPSFVHESSGHDLHMSLPAQRAAFDGASPAVVVADEFETYEQIRGLIAQGGLSLDRAANRAILRIDRKIGFSFAGRVSNDLQEER